jgi:hypothetical protein
MKPAGWEDKTEQELLQAIYDRNKDNPTSSALALLDFIRVFRAAHAAKPQKILYTFQEDKSAALNIATREVLFYDPDHADGKPIGIAGRHFTNSETKYSVYHRFNTGKRRAPQNRAAGLSAEVTKDLKRAVSIAVKQFKPLTEIDVAVRASDKARTELSRWVRETWRHSRILDSLDSVEEMQSLVSQGVIFKSNLFKDAATKVGGMVEYYRRLAISNIPMVFVVEHGGVLCTGRSEDTDDCRTVARFNTPEDMPEAVYSKYSLLRLMDVDTHLPEVGYRDKGGVCWLFGVTSDEFEKVIDVPSDC